jgi:hypothetical protein
LAEAQPGFYLGVSAGESTFDVKKDELDDVVLGVFFGQGLPVLTASSKMEDSDSSLALIAGYQFLPYIALEASYLDLGAAEYRSSGTINPPGPVFSAPASVDVDIETKGFTLTGIGSLPLGKVVDLHGRLGFFFAETELSTVVRIGSGTGTDKRSLDSNGVLFGVGAGFQFGQHFSMSLDWTRYDNVGDEDEDDDFETEAGFDIDALSLSAMFRF